MSSSSSSPSTSAATSEATAVAAAATSSWLETMTKQVNAVLPESVVAAGFGGVVFVGIVMVLLGCLIMFNGALKMYSKEPAASPAHQENVEPPPPATEEPKKEGLTMEEEPVAAAAAAPSKVAPMPADANIGMAFNPMAMSSSSVAAAASSSSAEGGNK